MALVGDVDRVLLQLLQKLTDGLAVVSHLALFQESLELKRGGQRKEKKMRKDVPPQKASGGEKGEGCFGRWPRLLLPTGQGSHLHPDRGRERWRDSSGSLWAGNKTSA